MRAAPLLLAIAAAAACTDEPAIELPPLDGFSSMILTAENALGISGAAYAIDRAGHPTKTISLARSSPDPLTLHIYLYAKTLADLGLEEGTVELAIEGALSRPLEPAARVFFAEDLGQGDIPWFDDPNMARTVWISGTREPTLPCPTLRAIEHVLPKRAWISVAIPIDADSALIATDDGDFFRASSSTVARISSLDKDVPHGAGFKDDDGVVWLAGCEGKFARLHFEGEGFRVEPTEPCDPGSWLGGASVIGLDGSRGDVPRELYSVTRHGHFIRTTERSSLVLVDIAHTIYFHYVSWVGPGEGIMVTREPSVIWFRNDAIDQVTPVWSDPESAPEITNTELLPDRGVVFVGYDTRHGTRINRLDGATSKWYVEAEKNLAGPTYDIRARGEGFALAGAAGHAGVYSPATGFCSTTIPGFVFYYAVPIGERHLLLAGFVEAGNASTDRVWWLEIGE